MRLLLALLVCACTSDSAPAEQDVFIALPSDFNSYTSWTHFYVGNVPDPNGVDLSGPRTVYINRLPPHGATAFPVGTIVVKVIETNPTPQLWQMFALVKRGGGYDIDGAPDWEWFGLHIDNTDRVVIDWRGTGPPPDGGYGGLGAALGCVFCHAAAETNDYVQTPALQLARF